MKQDAAAQDEKLLSLGAFPYLDVPLEVLGSKVRISGCVNPNIPHLYVGEITHLLYHLLTIDPNFQLDMLLCEMNCLLSPRFGSFSTTPMDQQETHRRLIIHDPPNINWVVKYYFTANLRMKHDFTNKSHLI